MQEHLEGFLGLRSLPWIYSSTTDTITVKPLEMFSSKIFFHILACLAHTILWEITRPLLLFPCEEIPFVVLGWKTNNWPKTIHRVTFIFIVTLENR